MKRKRQKLQQTQWMHALKKKLTEEEKVCVALRRVQRETCCATKTLDLVLAALKPHLRHCPASLKGADKVLKRSSGAYSMCLHGCIGCDNHVFLPTSTAIRCPHCRHPRYDARLKPNETCMYFPVRAQLQRLLSLRKFRRHLLYESKRKSAPEYISDVYDASRWQEKMGPPGDRLNRIGFQLCVDSFPMHARKGAGSAKPVQLMNLSLPPWLRCKQEYMLLLMLVPAHLKYKKSRKYYDFAADYEINDLHTNGVSGVRVILYGTTLDSPGRREVLNMQSVAAYYPCPHCLHTALPGIRSLCHGGYRRYLAVRSRWRQQSFRFNGHTYEFQNAEARPPPAPRTDRNVSEMVALARATRPFRGHKGPPLLVRWIAADWGGSICDVMHDYKLVCEMVLKCLVGYLPKGGVYAGWKKDETHRQDCELYGMFAEVADRARELPWRLSKQELDTVDRRTCRIWWPPQVDRLVKEGRSFWTRSNRMYKSIHKRYILLVLLPTVLHGFVPAVHSALLTLIYGLRRLDGQVFSVNEAENIGVEPGQRALFKEAIPSMRDLVVRGLVLLEGSFPIDHLNPGMHHVVHHPEQAGLVGILMWLAMFAFERYNKKMKGLVRNPHHAVLSLASNAVMDIATRFVAVADSNESETRAPGCELHGRNKFYTCVI